MLQELFKYWTSMLAAIVEASAAMIIVFAAIQATFRALRIIFHKNTQAERRKEAIRLSLGRWLSLALEFELAADIMRTAVAPTWNQIGQLAAIITLRTALNYFLEREISASERAHGTAPN